MDNIIAPFIDKTNTILGAIVMVLTWVFGEHWVLFAGYLLLNIIDEVSGTIAARIEGKSSSSKGLIGLLKKISYWIIIAVSFLIPVMFMEIGKVIHVDLGITTCLGWFTLATLTINEIRSIIENTVRSGFKNMPKILTKGLEVAEDILEDKTK